MNSVKSTPCMITGSYREFWYIYASVTCVAPARFHLHTRELFQTLWRDARFLPHDINKSTVSYIEWTGYFRMVLDSGKIHCLRWLILEGTPERMSSHSWQLVRQIVIRLPVNQYMNRCSVLYLIYIMLSSIYVHSTVCTSCRFRTDTDRSDKPCPLFSEPVS